MQLGSPAPQQESLLCCFFSSPALLQVGAHPVLVQGSNHNPDPGQAAGWEWGDTLRSPCTGDVPGDVFGCFAPQGQLRKTAPFVPLHCHIGKKVGGDNYCSSPSLLRILAEKWHSLSQPRLPPPDPTALVGKIRGRDVGSCSILLH